MKDSDKNAAKRAKRPLTADERKAIEYNRVATALLEGHDVNGRATYGQRPRHWGRHWGRRSA